MIVSINGTSICSIEVSNTISNETKLPSLVPSSCIASSHNQSHRHSTTIGPFERQLSLLDSLSDRVSTKHVWKNLTVLTREDEGKQCFQRIKLGKK
jgi:hypothetical protein